MFVHRPEYLGLLIGVFTVVLVVADISATKLVAVGPLIFSGGTLLYSVTFLITDTVSEIWGRQWARRIVWYGFFTKLLAVSYLLLVTAKPYPEFWTLQQAFEQIFHLVPRITIAGLIAYLVAQHFDIWMFHFWKRVTKGKHLWLRNIASTSSSQFVDTLVFTIIAFAGVVPFEGLVKLFIGQYLFKVLIALADTPLCYLLVRWARGGKKDVASEQNEQHH